MLFLIQYDKHHGDVISMREFDEAQRHEAEESRAQLELALSREGTDHEVVLLDAENLDTVRKTHQRYFEDAPALMKAVIDRQGNL